MLSNAAFNALLKTLEEPPEHVKFILATTEIQKIPATVLSRVQRYDLKRVNSSAIVGHLEKILQKENIVSEGGALKLVSREAEGSLRDALSLLDQVIVNSTGAVKIQTVNELLGKISKIKIFDLLSLILSGKTADTIIKAREYFQGSISPESLLRELMNIVHFVSLVVISNDFLSDESYTVEEQNRAKEIAKSTNTIRISSLWQILFKESVSIKVALDAIISFEMLIIKATHMSLLPEPESLIKSILENKEEHLKVIHSGKSIANLVREDKKEEKFLENKFYDVIETEHQKGEEQAIKEILEIFPGAKIDN
jgi:DNA polymerase-3 subunit gamma/tau